jgi:hypothetical protein
VVKLFTDVFCCLDEAENRVSFLQVNESGPHFSVFLLLGYKNAFFKIKYILGATEFIDNAAHSQTKKRRSNISYS